VSSAGAARLSLHLVSSPFLLIGGISFLALLTTQIVFGGPQPELGFWARLAALLPIAALAVLLALDGIQRIELEPDGIRVATLAGLFVERLLPFGPFRRGRRFRLNWSELDAVEIRIPRFQSPFRRAIPRGWLLAGSPGRVVRIPFGHPRFADVLEVIRGFVHPYFLHLPSRNWEGRIPGRPALTRMLRTVVFDPSTPPEFITETARACLLWGNFSRAERLMDLALAKSEEDEGMLDEYFRMMKRLGVLEKAKAALEKLLQRRKSAMDLVEMAEVHHAEGDDKSATEYLLQAASTEGESDLAHFLLGCLYVQRDGLEATALEQWKKGLDSARHPQLLGKLTETYRYHRELLRSPAFLLGERRREIRTTWSRRLGAGGIGLVLAGMTLWWIHPAAASPFPGVSGSMLILGGLLMLAALVLRRR
jgi:tetratricopeptide (TPR) repeat protein